MTTFQRCWLEKAQEGIVIGENMCKNVQPTRRWINKHIDHTRERVETNELRLIDQEGVMWVIRVTTKGELKVKKFTGGSKYNKKTHKWDD